MGGISVGDQVTLDDDEDDAIVPAGVHIVSKVNTVPLLDQDG